jgi:RimJ/RimL family protein N-acetyltransferase
MAHLTRAPWPPAPIKTNRLVVREPDARDRQALIDLFTSAEVGKYIGGARPRDDFERRLPEDNRRPGLFAVELDGKMIGIVTLDRLDAEKRGHIRPEGDEAALGYLFLPSAWGRGYATEACRAVLEWFAAALPGDSVVLSTQTANETSMRLANRLGFTEVERYEDWGAEQWLGVLSPRHQLD